MPVPVWQPGTLYQPGDLVQPTTGGGASAPSLQNPDFEAGATGWTFGGSNGVAIIENVAGFDGAWRLRLDDLTPGSEQYKTATNDELIPCTPGQIIIARCYAQCFSDHDETRALISIRWYDAADAFISATYMTSDPTIIGGVHQRITPADPGADGLHGGLIGLAAFGVFTQISVQGVAPANAAKFTVRVQGNWLQEGGWYFDTFTLEFGNVDPPNPFIFQAVQAAAGFSGSSEPTWPTVLGNQVVDNEVTWEAVSGNSVTWEAHRILVTGAVEPTWPLVVNGAVPDNTISWILDSRRVTDSRVPTDSNVVIFASSKVFVGDGDIINFSATVNPLDFSTPQDAGYVGFGLQQYGGNPVTAVGLYRGNLAAFNSEGCQLWQLDEDPAGIVYLDAIPVPCTFPKTVQPVGDDLALLTNLGARSLGLSGANVNLQGGYFGQQIDPLVLAAIAAAELAGVEPFALYWPARGQYWLIFEETAFVLTITAGPGGKITRSWSRYVFPEAITDWTIAGTDLVLRTATDKVWTVDPSALRDDEDGVPVEFEGVLQWPFIDLGVPGNDKEMIAFDLVCTGEVAISVGWDQRNTDYDALTTWTEEYTVDGDTLPREPVPYSVTGPTLSMRLRFTGNQAWQWDATNMYVKDLNK